MKVEKYSSGPLMYQVTGIESDMGEGVLMDLLIQNDGDAVVTLWNREEGQRIDIEVCTYQGGTHTPGLAMKLREVAEYLYRCQEDPEYEKKYIAWRLTMPE